MKPFILFTLFCLASAWNSFAQLSLPTSGDNQKAKVTQQIGLVTVTIAYSSPNVISEGRDRTGKIWGELVHYGFIDLGFGSSKAAPWRAGANENTTFEVSHEVMIEGKTLPAGKYGLFIATEKDKPWTIMFSKNSSSWGSYYYSPDEDALRVEIMPQTNEFRQWLTYEFTERKADAATVAMMWEKLKLPIKITVPKTNEYYVKTLRDELRSAMASSENYAAAARFCAENKINLEEALVWADISVSGANIGQKSYATLAAKAQVLTALDKKEEAGKLMKEAVMHPTASATDVHQHGRRLLGAGKKEEALEIFKFNAEKNKTDWVVNVGLTRGYSAVGNYKKALEVAQIALKNAPDDLNKKSLTNMIELLKQGKDVNAK